MLDKISLLQKYILEAKKIVFFGGAGVSTESGIPDFRSQNGIFKQTIHAEEIVSHDFFFSHTKEFYEFYKSKMMYLDAKPNACHLKLAEIEKKKDLTIITQNIDSLHQKAGSKKVIELHGSIYSNTCLVCQRKFSAEFIKESKGVPICPYCHSIIKPDVVLYGESLDYNVITSAIKALQEADLLIVGGTSLKVYPASSFLSYYQGNRKVFIDLNENNTLTDYLFIQGKIGEIFSKIKI